MAHSVSNPISEYDFAEIPDEISDQQIDLVHENIDILRMDENVKDVLRGFQLDAEVFEKFAAHGIKFSQLITLSDADLLMLGVRDDEKRARMITEFAIYAGQQSKYQQGDGAENTESVIDHLQNQLQSLDLLLAATILKIGAAQSGSSPGVLIGSNFNSPEIVIEMLQKMTAHTDEIGILIKNLRDHENMQQKEREMNLQSYKNMAIKGILLASGVIVGFFIAKTLRGGGGKSSI